MAVYAANKGISTSSLKPLARARPFRTRCLCEAARHGRAGRTRRDRRLPISTIVTKEIKLRGSFRFDKEFALAVDLIGSGRIDVSPLLSDTLPLVEAKQAFLLAGDKSNQ